MYVGREDGHLMAARGERAREAVDGADRAAVPPGRQIGGDDVQDLHAAFRTGKRREAGRRAAGGSSPRSRPRPLAGMQAAASARRRMAGTPEHPLGERCAVAGRHDPTGLTATHQVLRSDHRAHEDGGAAGEGLGHGHAVGVVAGGKDQEIGAAQLRRERRLRYRADDRNAGARLVRQSVE